jgi:hypothetical protein
MEDNYKEYTLKLPAVERWHEESLCDSCVHWGCHCSTIYVLLGLVVGGDCQPDQGIRITGLLFGDEHASLAIVKYVQLFKREQQGGFSVRFHKVHGWLNGSIFMPVLANVECIGWLWVVTSDVSYMFSIAEFQAPAGLTYVFQVAGIAG